MNEPRSFDPVIRHSHVLWIGFTTFVVRAFADIVRYSSLTIAPPAVMTALYFVVFGELIGHRVGRVNGFDYEHYIAPGLIMIPIITSSYSQAALSFFTAKFHRSLEEHLVSPQPSWIIVVSYVAGGMMRGILVGVAVGLVALLLAHSTVRHGFLMIGSILLTSLVSSLTGLVNAVFAKSFDQINGILSFVLTPLTYCGGVFYSLSLLPLWAQTLSLANPIVYLVNLFRYSMLGVSDVPIGVAVSIQLVAALALYGVAAMLMKRGTGIRE